MENEKCTTWSEWFEIFGHHQQEIIAFVSKTLNDFGIFQASYDLLNYGIRQYSRSYFSIKPLVFRLESRKLT